MDRRARGSSASFTIQRPESKLKQDESAAANALAHHHHLAQHDSSRRFCYKINFVLDSLHATVRQQAVVALCADRVA
jgi:hypothetical protein